MDGNNETPNENETLHKQLLIDLKRCFEGKVKDEFLVKQVARLENKAAKMFAKIERFFETHLLNAIDNEKQWLENVSSVVKQDEAFDETLINEIATLAKKARLLRKSVIEESTMKNEVKVCDAKIQLLNEILNLLQTNETNIVDVKAAVNEIVINYDSLNSRSSEIRNENKFEEKRKESLC